MPDLSNIHIDVFLTAVSIAFTNPGYIAPQVAPVVPVELRSNKYVIYNKDTFLRSSLTDPQGKPSSIRRPGTRSAEILFDISNQSYYCEQLARSYPLADAEVRLADSTLQPAMDATMALTETVTLDNEIQVANKAMLRSNYAAANKVQLVNGTTSWAAATGKPITVDIPAGRKAVVGGIIRTPNAMALNFASAVTLAANAEYRASVQYVTREALTGEVEGLAPLVGGLEPVVALTQKITSTEFLTTYTNGYVWVDDQGQDSALIYYKPASVAGLRTIAYMLTFEAPDDTFGGRGYLVKRWREEWRDVEMIEVRTTRDWRFPATDGSTNGDNANGYAVGGYLISGTTL